jgi:flagellar biosynthetic protein FliR
MTEQMLQQFSEQQVAGFILVLARITPLFIIAPLFSSRMLPARVRGIAAVGIAVGIAPLAMRGHEVPIELLPLGELVFKEMLVGLAYAFAIAVVFAAVSTAGNFIDTLIGFSYGSVVDPVTGVQAPVLSQLYGLVGVMIFIAIGGDGWMIQGLARTYDLVPLLAMPSLAAMVAGAQQGFISIFHSAVEIAAPVILALVITDAAFGVVARVVPQMNVFAVGFPAKIAVGLVILVASLPFVGGWIADELERSIAAGLDSIEVVTP